MVTTNALQEQAKSTSLPIIQILTPPTSLLPYNISLNLSSLFAIFPTSGILSRLRQGIHWSGRTDIEDPTTTTTMEWTMETLEALAEVPKPEPTAVSRTVSVESYPGLWTFFTSRYILALFVLGIVIHRIQNVIIPPQPDQYPRRRQRHAFRFAFNFATPYNYAQQVKAWLVPMDFSRTSTRFVVHLPSGYLMCRMLLVWGLLLVQTAPELHFLPKVRGFEWLEGLVHWVTTMEMRDICWGTFCAAAAAMVVEGLINALDGQSLGWIGTAHLNASPFNLVAYAYLLSVYSSPVTHSLKSSDSDGPSRPDKHVVITLSLPFLQLVMFHMLSISKRWAKHRLLPTTLTTVLSLLHFHGTLFSFYKRARLHAAMPDDPHPRRVHLPLLNYIPNLIETILIFNILLTITINSVAQLLVRGHIDRVLSGLGINYSYDESGLRGFLANLPYEEDFGVMLVRIGTASLEATGLKGLSNEVAPISAASAKSYRPGPTVRIGRMGVQEVLYDVQLTSPSSTSKRSVGSPQAAGNHTNRKSKKKLRLGFYNEIHNVDLGISEAVSPWISWTLYLKALYEYLLAMREVLIALAQLLRGRSCTPEATDVILTPCAEEVVSTPIQQNWQSKEEELYQRFLRGEDISDDEDEASPDETDSDSDFGEDLNEEGEEDSGQAEAISLFTDLVRNGGMPPRSPGEIGGGGEMVLAHLVHGGGSSEAAPLTRGRWNQLFQTGDVRQRRRWPGNGSFNDAEDGDARGLPPAQDAGDDSEGATMENVCVICACEKRNVICWPCRCLALCDGCREALASKSIPARHQCPCCRQSVDGYSKIYIP